MRRIKGKDINLFIDGVVIAGSTSCTLNLTANTADAATKSDPGSGEWDNPEFTNSSWNMANESFIASAGGLQTLLAKVITGDAIVEVQINDGSDISLAGRAIITQLQISAPNGDKATLSLSLEGCTPLEESDSFHSASSAAITPLRGKSLMLAMQDNAGDYHTLAASTSHSLTVSVQTAEVTTKDDNDKATYKEVTGRSVSLSTENLVAVQSSAQATGITFVSLLNNAVSGSTLKLAFGYYSASVGAEAGDDADWGASSSVLVTGDFLCSSISLNAGVRDNSTYSAEFSGKGAPSVGAA